MARNEQSSLDRYLDVIGKIPLLTAEEEITLARQVQKARQLQQLDRPLTKTEQRLLKRGARAKERMVQGNLRLVVFVAKKSASKAFHMEMLDLIQEATLGLIRAVEMFDPERGYKFSTYAYWWVRQAISRGISVQDRAIRRPCSVSDLASKLAKLKHTEAIRLGRQPTISELAEAASCKVEDIEHLMNRGSHCASLDAIVSGTDELARIDVFKDENALTADELTEQMDLDMGIDQLAGALERLNDVEREVLIKRFGLYGQEPMPLHAIGVQCGVSRERVRQIAERAVRKLKFWYTENQTVEAQTVVTPIAPIKISVRKSQKASPQDFAALKREWSFPARRSA